MCYDNYRSFTTWHDEADDLRDGRIDGWPSDWLDRRSSKKRMMARGGAVRSSGDRGRSFMSSTGVPKGTPFVIFVHSNFLLALFFICGIITYGCNLRTTDSSSAQGRGTMARTRKVQEFTTRRRRHYSVRLWLYPRITPAVYSWSFARR